MGTKDKFEENGQFSQSLQCVTYCSTVASLFTGTRFLCCIYS